MFHKETNTLRVFIINSQTAKEFRLIQLRKEFRVKDNSGPDETRVMIRRIKFVENQNRERNDAGRNYNSTKRKLDDSRVTMIVGL